MQKFVNGGELQTGVSSINLKHISHLRGILHDSLIKLIKSYQTVFVGLLGLTVLMTLVYLISQWI